MSQKKIPINQAAKKLNLSINEINSFIKAGTFRSSKKGGTLYLFEDEVTNYINRHNKPPVRNRSKLARIVRGFRLLIVIIAAFGLYQTIGQDFYQKFIRYKLFPPIKIVPTDFIEFEQSEGKSEKKFWVENTSSESHFQIEIALYLDNVQREFEIIEIEESNPNMKPNESNKHSYSILPNVMIFKGPDKLRSQDGRIFDYIRIQKLDPNENIEFFVTYKSIKRNKNKINGTVKLPIEVISYDKASLSTSTTSDELPYHPIEILEHKVKKFKEQTITILFTNDGKWFRLNEICDIFDIEQPENALDSLHYSNKSKVIVVYSNGSQTKEFVISEGGILQLSKFSKSISLINEFIAWESDISKQ